MNKEDLKKEDIHINFIQEVLKLQGYEYQHVNHINYDNISIDDDYIIVEVDNTEFAISINEYLNYRDWWLALERERQINEILNDV